MVQIRLMVFLVALTGCELAESPDGVALQHTAVEDLRIDGHEHDLVPINWLGVAPDGRIALLQPQDNQVRFFDTEGRALGAVGREGEGPGEFQRLIRAGWLGDSLWVSDTRLRRTAVISPDLEVARQLLDHARAEPATDDTTGLGAYLSPFTFAVYADDETLAWAVLPEINDGELPEEGTPMVRLSADGAIRHLVAMVPNDPEGTVTIELAGGAVRWAQVPFAAESVRRVAPDGSLVAHLSSDLTNGQEPTYRVFARDASGALVFDRTYPFEPVSIPESVLDSAIVAAATEEGSVNPGLESELRRVAPSVYAEAQRIAIGGDRRIWIGMRPRDGERRWRILAPTGEPELDLTLPSSVTVWAADGDHVWGVDRDALGVDSAVRYRISP